MDQEMGRRERVPEGRPRPSSWEGQSMRRGFKIFPPRPPRETVEEKAILRLQCGNEAPILVRNRSEGGFMAETGRFVWIGSSISVDWPGCGVRQAQVRWALPGRFGAAFQEG